MEKLSVGHLKYAWNELLNHTRSGYTLSKPNYDLKETLGNQGGNVGKDLSIVTTSHHQMDVNL